MKRTVTSFRNRAVLGVAALTVLGVLLPAGTAQANYVATVLADNPVAYWRLNETGGDGTIVYDKANAAGLPQQGAQDGVFLNTNANAGLGYAGPRPTDYIGFESGNNAGRYWNDANGLTHVDAGNPAALRITGALTLEAWVYQEGTDNMRARGVVSKFLGSGNNRCYNLLLSSKKPTLNISPDGTNHLTNGKQISVATALAAETWYHVVGVYVPSTSMEIYVNGVLGAQLTTGVPSQIFDSSAADVWIGAQFSTAAGDCFQGRIDEVAIYNYALSAAQIQAHYDASFVPVPEPGTFALLVAGLAGLLCYAWRKRK